MKTNDANNLIGCCGLYCGLCNKYQSNAPSRCVGCKLGEQHSWCSIWNCCVRKNGFETCAECREIFDCAVFMRRKVVEWIPAADNLRQIKEDGLEIWLTEQIERHRWVERLLEDYNDGRSMSFYCKACSRMPIESIHRAIVDVEEKFKRENIDESDLKSKAKMVKTCVQGLAGKAGVNLK